MAMHYETGTASSQHDLLDKLRTFLIAKGWTIDWWADDITYYYSRIITTGEVGKRLHAHIGGLYVNFRSAVRAIIYEDYTTGSETNTGYECYIANARYYSEVTGIGFNVSTGFNSSNRWDKQPGGPVTSAGKSYGGVLSYIGGAVPSYRFFYSDDATNPMLLVSVEKAPGVFVHALCCMLEKFGTYTGGAFFCGSGDYMYVPKTPLCKMNPFENSPRDNFLVTGSGGESGRGALRIVGEDGNAAGTYADWRVFDGTSLQQANNAWTCHGPITLNSYPWPYHDTLKDFNFLSPCTEGSILACSPSAYNVITPLVRVPIFVKRNKGSASFQGALAGYVPNMRLIRMDAYAVGEVVSYGADNWMLLPMNRKGIDGYTIGIAVKVA